MKRIFLAAFLLLSFFACKKGDDDIASPSVTITSPASGQLYNVFDTISVSFSCSDDKQLASYSVKLEDSNLIPVEPVIDDVLSGTSQTVNFLLVIDNIRITTGNYYVAVNVSDGTKETTSYCGIHITAAPKVMKGIFAVTHPSVNSTNIYQSDTLWTPSVFTSSTIDFFDMEVSSYWQQVVFDGRDNAPLKAMSIDGTMAGWMQNTFTSTVPYWGFISTHDSRYWVSVPGLDNLRSFDQTGRLLNTFLPDNNYKFKRHLQVGNKVFTEQSPVAAGADNLVVYSLTSGALQESPISGTIVSMFERSEHELYVLTNNSGQGELHIYDYDVNAFWSPINLASGATVLSAAQIDSGTLLIAMSNGNIYKFTYNPVGLLVQTSGVHPSQMEFDANGAHVVTSEATSIKEWDYPGFTVQHTINYPDTVRKFDIWYNH